MPEAKVTWTHGTQLVAESGSGHGFVMDKPKAKGGGGTGPSPMEMLLAAQAGCTAIDVLHILKEKMRKEISELEVQVVGTRAETVPMVYTEVELAYRLSGPGLQEKDVARAVSLSAEKYCSVSVMMAKTARLKISYEVLDSESGAVSRGSVEL